MQVSSSLSEVCKGLSRLYAVQSAIRSVCHSECWTVRLCRSVCLCRSEHACFFFLPIPIPSPQPFRLSSKSIMARPLQQVLKLIPLLLLIPIFFTARSTYTFERYLSSLSITLADFPPTYADALTKATINNEHTFDYDYSVFDTSTDIEANNSIPKIIHFIWFQVRIPDRRFARTDVVLRSNRNGRATRSRYGL